MDCFINTNQFLDFMQVFSMLPGFSAELMPKGREKESQAKIKRYMTMMDSMTDEGKHLRIYSLQFQPHDYKINLYFDSIAASTNTYLFTIFRVGQFKPKAHERITHDANSTGFWSSSQRSNGDDGRVQASCKDMEQNERTENTKEG